MGEPDASPSKRLKTLIETLIPAPPPSAKGKEKMDAAALTAADFGGGAEDLTCGICLSDGWKTMRGLIDSCDHCFCFVCIMEWSKVESRCPMCKQRFQTVRRPCLPPHYFRERVVHVPVRNQAHNPFGNEAVETDNPYSDVNCSVCQTSADENLLLLCDLCDSAAHTYCVGLGATVPEGDWYCADCTFSKSEHSKIEAEDICCTPDSYKDSTGGVTLPVSITEIVSHETDSASPRSLSTASEHCRHTDDERLLSNRASYKGGSQDRPLFPAATISVTDCSAIAKFSKEDAKTLKGRRNLHDRIRILRENWDALRSGSLSFSSGTVNVGCMKSNSTYDENRAWRMMQAAKSIQNGKKGCLPNSCPPKYNVRSNILMDKTKIPLNNAIPRGSISSVQPKAPFSELAQKDLKAQNHCKKLDKPVKKVRPPNCERAMDIDMFRICKKLSSNKTDIELAQGSFVQRTEEHQQNIQVFPSGITVPSFGRPEHITSEQKIPSKLNLEAGQNPDRSSVGRISAAKSEVQSLVKLNMKLQLIDKPIGTDKYKEVARIATHTILAACGLEHSKSCARPFHDSVCRHSEKTRQLHRSKLMSKSCKECFYTFVKNVVVSVIASNFC